MLRRQIVESINGDVPVPKAWLEAVNEFQNQQRNIEYVTLGPAQAGDIPAPTPEQLSKYFEERKIMFRAPEYRKVEVIAVVTPEELGRWMEISGGRRIKAEFDARRSSLCHAGAAACRADRIPDHAGSGRPRRPGSRTA